MNRPTQDQYFMRMARLAATRSNCYRRQVGCVLVDVHNRIMATGYNGVPRDYPHCEIGSCPREIPGQDLHLCLAIHAEMNAILQCRNIDDIFKIYVTDSPCIPCTSVLLNTNCYQIIFEKSYPNDSQSIWENRNRKWTQYETIRNTGVDK